MSKTPLHQLISFYCPKWAMISLLLIITESSCNNHTDTVQVKPPTDTTYNDWLRWEITFKPNVDSQTRVEDLKDAQQHLNEYVDSSNKKMGTHFTAVNWSPQKVDSLNYTITAGLRGAAADSITPTPIKDGPKLMSHLSKMTTN